MKKHANVALIIETASDYGRQILRGISRYIDVYANWSVFLDERGRTMYPPLWLADWDGDGMICRATTPAAEKLGFEAAAWLDRLMKAKANHPADDDSPVKQIYLR